MACIEAQITNYKYEMIKIHYNMHFIYPMVKSVGNYLVFSTIFAIYFKRTTHPMIKIAGKVSDFSFR